MLNIINSTKSIQEIVNTIQELATKFGFGVQYVHNIKNNLEAKGRDLKEECQIIDICSPDIALELLDADMSISTILPCSIAVYTKNGETFIAMNSLVQLVDDINPDLIPIATKAQESLLQIIKEAK